MPTLNLGRVGFVNKGAYIGGTTAYKINDIVVYNSGIYACIQAHSTSHLPTDVLYWQKWTGNTADAIANTPAGNISAVTVQGAIDELDTEKQALSPNYTGVKAVSLASASVVDIGAAAGDFIHITGTTTITSFGTVAAGVKRTLIFDGSLTITYNVTSMILPYGVDVVTTAGDSAVFVSEGSGNWKCVSSKFTNETLAGNKNFTGSINAPQLVGLKNYLINGNLDVWQYATSQTSSGYGSDDRWSNLNTGSTKTHSQVASTDTERALFSASYFSRTAVTSVVGASNYARKSQRIENVTKLSGKTITVSFWAKADASKNISIEFVQSFGTGGTPSADVTSVGSQLVSLTTAWQKKTITVSIPSIVGKTLGSDGVHTSYTSFNFWFDAGSDFNARTASLGQQSGTFDIAQVQIEEGSVATPFEQRPYAMELSLCQRYYRTYTRYIPATGVISFDGNFRITPTLAGIGTSTTLSNDKSGFVLQEVTGQTRTVTASAEL